MTNTEKRQPMKLSNVFWCGLGFSVAVIGICFYFFAWQAAGRKRFWLAGLDQETYFTITRNAVTLAGALVVGVTIFFSYRKQQTAESAQTLAQDTLQLSLDKHDLEKVGELRNRYARSAEQLASDKRAVQLAGLHSLAALADDWQALDHKEDQQVCIALLCSVIDDSNSTGPGGTLIGSEATELVFARLRAGTDPSKQWSARTIKLDRPALAANLRDVSITGGELHLRNPRWPDGVMFENVQMSSGSLALLGDISSPWFVGSSFSGGRVTITPENDLEVLSVIFGDSAFTGANIQLIPEGNRALNVDFMGCTFTGGEVVIYSVANPTSITFTNCLFESASVVRVTARKSTPPQVIFKKCTYVKDGAAMEKDPKSAIWLEPKYARPLDEVKY